MATHPETSATPTKQSRRKRRKQEQLPSQPPVNLSDVVRVVRYLDQDGPPRLVAVGDHDGSGDVFDLSKVKILGRVVMISRILATNHQVAPTADLIRGQSVTDD